MDAHRPRCTPVRNRVAAAGAGARHPVRHPARGRPGHRQPRRRPLHPVPDGLPGNLRAAGHRSCRPASALRHGRRVQTVHRERPRCHSSAGGGRRGRCRQRRHARWRRQWQRRTQRLRRPRPRHHGGRQSAGMGAGVQLRLCDGHDRDDAVDVVRPRADVCSAEHRGLVHWTAQFASTPARCQRPVLWTFGHILCGPGRGLH
mmetsp:Transcript_12467/g.18025  ORF Transcript_12467/g.18025 Transcript_12467/m.18025 type:complete len:202 (-) Transcript_12467:90-695(-)